MTIKVSIVEDDEPTAQILKSLVTQAPKSEFLSSYQSPDLALERLPQDAPDVVLMDINLPGMNGVQLVQALKGLMPKTQFLMLTVYEDEDHIFAALKAGATGYLLKGTRKTELLAAIKQVVEGGSPMSSAIARKVVASFSCTTTGNDPIETLSPRETAVLSLLAKGYMYKEIADQLGIGTATVCTFIRRIYEKLQVNSRTQAITRFLKHTK